MAPPTLYYTIFSPPVRGVLMTAKAIDLELNLKSVNLFIKEQYSEEYRKLNPQHTVPTLVDGDFILWDSHAIVIYLVEKYAKDDSLYPKDLQKRAKINQRLFFDASVLFPPATAIVRKIAFGAKEIPQESIDAFYTGYEFVEAFLNDSNYIAGDTLSVADLCLYPLIISCVIFLPLDEVKFPRVKDYIKRMELLHYAAEINNPGLDALSQFVDSKLAQNSNL